VTNSPKVVTIILVQLPQEGEPATFENFTGIQAAEVTKTVTLNCLYNKNDLDFDESYAGYQNIASGTLYFSPKQLIQAFGTFRLDGREVRFVLDGKEYNTIDVSLSEELFDTCIAVEFNIKDKLRG
jgi:hypothetical protein